MSETVGDFIVGRLHDWGINRIYGYPGDGINGLLGALRRAEDKVRFVQTRHEEEAAFMACAHAKWTDDVGICLATSGPGAIHLLNGLYDAKKDHMPVVAIVGQQARTAIGGNYQQEVDLISLFKDVAHEYVHSVSTPAQTRHVIDQAVRVAKSRRAVTCVILPNDLQEEDMADPPREHGAVFSGVGISTPRVVPRDEDLQRAADVLNAGSRVAMLVGAGVKHAVDEMLEISDILGAGIAKALLAKMMVPDDLPHVTGAIGLLGTEPSWNLMQKCDTLLMIGSSFPYSEFLPEEGKARGVQIDLEAKNLGIRYPMEVNLVGDSGETIRALIPLLERKADRSWRQQIEDDVSEWWEVVENRAMNDADPINPQRVFWELSKRLPENAILTADSGSSANWYARQIKARRNMMGSLSGGLATMCPGVPYAAAAKFCHPTRPVIGLVGDGAMQMLGNNALITVSKYWEEWSNPQFIILVVNNRDLNQVTWEQRVLEGDPMFETSQRIPDFAYDEYAESLGLVGLRMESVDDVEQVWDEALAARRPVVINAYTDPNVPPLPPHIDFEQARSFFASLIKGDPEATGTIRQSLKGMASKYKEKVSP